MPLLGKRNNHKGCGPTGPYGLGARFAIGSGERIAASRRGTAQMKAFLRRYPGMLPQGMDFISGGMFGNGQSAGLMSSFEGLRHGQGFSQFEDIGWEDQLPNIPHLFLQDQFQPPFTFASSRAPAFGGQSQYFWPGGDINEGLPRSQGMRWPMTEGSLSEFGTHGHPEVDYLKVYGDLRMRYFPHSFDHYHSGGFELPQNEPFSDHHYHGSEGARDNGPIGSPVAGRPDRAGRFNAYDAEPHSWRGSPRDSYERLRPEDL